MVWIIEVEQSTILGLYFHIGKNVRCIDEVVQCGLKQFDVDGGEIFFECVFENDRF